MAKSTNVWLREYCLMPGSIVQEVVDVQSQLHHQLCLLQPILDGWKRPTIRSDIRFCISVVAVTQFVLRQAIAKML
jgi:hypothetical protein